MDFYLKFLSTIYNPVQLLLNLLKTGFVGSIPVDKVPKRLYNGTGMWIGGFVYVAPAHRFRPKSRRIEATKMNSAAGIATRSVL